MDKMLSKEERLHHYEILKMGSIKWMSKNFHMTNGVHM